MAVEYRLRTDAAQPLQQRFHRALASAQDYLVRTIVHPDIKALPGFANRPDDRFPVRATDGKSAATGHQSVARQPHIKLVDIRYVADQFRITGDPDHPCGQER